MGDDPYPALRAHAKLGKHPNTYEANGKTICEECGEILDNILAERVKAAETSARFAKAKQIAAEAASVVAQIRLELAEARQKQAELEAQI